MAILALADIHLSNETNKPMDIFGAEWKDHQQKLEEKWDHNVNSEDLVIIPGDISWAMYITEAQADLNWISDRPGTKLLVRGNHDYWWNSIGKVRKALPDGMYALQNDCFEWSGGEWLVCGSRGWICPGDTRFDNDKDLKIYEREVQRLDMSLKCAKINGDGRIIVAMHFPPFNVQHDPSGFTELMEEYGVEICVYGHLHADARRLAIEGSFKGVKYIFTAADHLEFQPLLVAE